MEVKLTLPWKINSFIHYTLQSQWPLKGHKCRILVHLEGKYFIFFFKKKDKLISLLFLTGLYII